ncbi:MAG TPA: PHP domain-containing protein, partial [Chitinophagaceae bacterium]
IQAFFGENYKTIENTGTYLSLRGPENIQLGFHLAPANIFCKKLFETSCAGEFLDCWNEMFTGYETASYGCEDDIFSHHGLTPVPAFYRERKSALKNPANDIIRPEDIRGIIHTHSRWSDGVNTIEEMAKAAKEMRMEYLVISDHSKTAAYAQGLSEERVAQQHKEINALNEKLAPFRIFRSIESDILGDGSLDYPNNILATFDFVIASIHSNLYMSEEKAMSRLLRAIENPYTSILGHLTGRLLLSRNGYPVDYRRIIDACAANDVVIELNSHPRRLDMDWRQIGYALEKGVLISIDPDAHDVTAFNDTRYGVLAAQKAGLPSSSNLSSFSLSEFCNWVKKQQSKR